MQSILSRIANYALFGACCFQTAQITNDVIAHSMHGAAMTPAAVTAPAPEAAPDWQERQKILDRNLFGAKIAGAQEPFAEVVSEDVEQTKLPLTLEATIAGSGRWARASIYDTQKRESQVLQPGDSIDGYPGVTLDRVERRRILLLNKGRREELLLPEETGANARPSDSAGRRPRRETRSSRVTSADRRERARKRAGARTEPDAELKSQLGELRDRMMAGQIDVEAVQEELERLREEEEEEEGFSPEE
jgi:hypothetical protein